MHGAWEGAFLSTHYPKKREGTKKRGGGNTPTPRRSKCTNTWECPVYRLNCGKGRVSWRRPRRAASLGGSHGKTCAATFTCTQTGVTVGPGWRKWSKRPVSAVWNTYASLTTPSL